MEEDTTTGRSLDPVLCRRAIVDSRASQQLITGTASHRRSRLTCTETSAPRMARGFRTVGIYQERGPLDGHWVDVIIMEMLLG